MKKIMYVCAITLLIAGLALVSSKTTKDIYFILYMVCISVFGFIMGYLETKKESEYNAIKHFPPNVVELMLQRQYEQQLKKDLSVFIENEFAQAEMGGFDWDKTPEGYSWWLNVIMYEKFDLLNSQRN